MKVALGRIPEEEPKDNSHLLSKVFPLISFYLVPKRERMFVIY